MSRWISVFRFCRYQFISNQLQQKNDFSAPLLFYNCQQRFYAKGKDKRKETKGKKVSINEDEIAELIDLEKFKADISKAVDNLRSDYLKSLSLRSTTGSIDSLQINLEGKKVDLMEVARIIRSTPGTVILDMATHSHAIPLVVRAIEKSGMNLNPRQDGTSVYVPIPRVTKEYREGLSKNAKAMFIHCRDEIKSVQNKFLKVVRGKSKEGVSEDTVHSVSDQITELGNVQIHLAEKMLEKKQKELLE